MTSDSSTVSAATAAFEAGAQPVRLRSVALPVEHGGWGMLGEPIVLGLLVAPSAPALGVGLAAAFAFLARHPMKLAIADWRQGRRTARRLAAARFAWLYAGLAAACLALAARAPAGWWWPLALAAPLALVQLLHDVRNKGRQLLPELGGGIALGSIVSAELLASGWSLAASLAAWAIVAVKAAAAILYVRARLRCDRGLAFAGPTVLLVHAMGLLLALVLAAAQQTPWLAAGAFGLLFARAAYGLSRFHRRVRPQAVGLAELAYGVAFVLLTALGYASGF
jgi:YwiC-like protein